MLPRMTLEPGVVVGGDFRVEARLGEGGMGEVWIAEQISVGRKRALKVMRRELVGDAKLRERFALEARIGATIASDHVVEVVGAGVDEALRVPWIAMELLEGESLESAIAKQGGLARADVAAMLDQLGHALAAAHAAGVVHRDLKPENVFLARPRRSGAGPFVVKVLDFGIAKLVEGAQAATSGQSLLVGTPLFMAPEQTEPRVPCMPATDVWALGLIAYRALTGRFFWRATGETGMTITSVLRQVLVDPIPPASTRAAEDGDASALPPGFDEWFVRCVARAPEARYAEAGVACEALSRMLVGAGPSQPPATTARADLELAETTVSVRHPIDRARAPGALAVELLHTSDHFSYGRLDPFLVVRWWRPITVASLEEMGRVTGRALATGPGQFFVIPVVDKSLKRPEDGAADALDFVMKTYEHRIDGVANVVLGTGFHSAMVRALITGMTLARRPRHPVKIVATIAAAVDTFGTVPKRDAIVEAIERFALVDPPKGAAE